MARVDLHVHSTASDGEYAPAQVVGQAAECGLAAVAITDHDTLAGLPEAIEAGKTRGLRVVSGCEFSVAATWGELHLLGYFLPLGDAVLEAFCNEQQSMRSRRGCAMVERLRGVGVPLELGEVEAVAAGAPLGRPHVAQALVRSGYVRDVQAAFDRYLAVGRSAFVDKQLPALARVVALIRSLGGVSAAAHLGQRASRRAVRSLNRAGVDAIEVRHPSHDQTTVDRLDAWTAEAGLLPTGGSDWHGEHGTGAGRALGTPAVPATWLEGIERLHVERVGER